LSPQKRLKKVTIQHLQEYSKTLQMLNPCQFEDLIIRLLTGFGWEIQPEPKEAAATGVHGYLAVSKVVPGLAVIWLIECKSASPSHVIGVEEVRRLYGAMIGVGASNALLATTGRITQGARDYAQSKSDVHLIDSDEIVAWLMQANSMIDLGRLFGQLVEDVRGDGALLLTPQSRYSLSFDGSSGHVTIGKLDHKKFAFACWVKRERSRDLSCQGHGEPLFHSTTNDGWGVAFESKGKEDSDKLFLSKIGVSEVRSTGKIADKLWHYIAVNFDGSQVTFYIDGVLDSTPDCSNQNFVFSEREYTIGSAGKNRHFKGNLDDVGIFPSLSAEQVKELYAGTLDPSSLSPFALWKFEEGSGDSANDSSGNGHTGTLAGKVAYSLLVPGPLMAKGGPRFVHGTETLAKAK